MADSFITISKNNLTKDSKTLEKIDKEKMSELYDRLNDEIRLRGGYQSITKFNAKEKNNMNSDTDEKVNVIYFNDAMQTRPYINSQNENNLYENAELNINRQDNYYKQNKEEWYQKSDKNKIETLIYDLDQGKSVPLNNSNFAVNATTKAATGCNNICTGTCSNTCGGTSVA